MRVPFLRSTLIAVVGIGLIAGNAFSTLLPTTDWPGADLNGFLNLSYFPGVEKSIENLNFGGSWIYTAIAHESGNINLVEETAVTGFSLTNATFDTKDYSNWGQWNEINFDTSNLFFEDSNGAFNVKLDPFTSTSINGFKVYQLTDNSNLLNYLPNNRTFNLKAGDYIIGFNDNQLFPDADYDDIIIAMRPVPEPATMLLVGIGFAGVAVISRRRKKQA